MKQPRTKTLAQSATPTSPDQILAAAAAATHYLEWCGTESFMLVPEKAQYHQDPATAETTPARPAAAKQIQNLVPRAKGLGNERIVQGAKPGG